ncbi:flagellar export chaperone FliS [Pluralibacter sp.]|jgi:flagellar protein FliS|uniref:flagellar export chaperone FliS n=1 Tax=Pluralibacter sp. TaxID=1920032 RepID=UPI0025EECDA4|nr:flagellar export chaperone FliS [Pluralibacter sp.]MBV8043957.1 flagellar export chaperone FliS [Pluralibacter sp.]
MFNNDNPLVAYRQNAGAARIAAASPQQLVVILLEYLLDELDAIENYITTMQLNRKGDSISKCLEILHVLDASLDTQNGGELAENLHQLYDFCSRRLLTVNLRNQPEPLVDVRRVLIPLKEGWEGTT